MTEKLFPNLLKIVKLSTPFLRAPKYIECSHGHHQSSALSSDPEIQNEWENDNITVVGVVRELIEIRFNENRGTCKMDDNDFLGKTIINPFLLLVEGTINNFNIPMRGWDVRLQS